MSFGFAYFPTDSIHEIVLDIFFRVFLVLINIVL